MLIINSLTQSIPGKELFGDLSFTLNRGDRLGLIGQNGCGKSTLLRTIAGLLPPDSGTIQATNEAVHLVPQHLEAAPGATIDDYFNLTDHPEAWRLLSELGLIELPIDTPLAQLSGGQKTKLLLVNAFASTATVLLLDEPTNHLDAETRTWLIAQLLAYSGIVLVISHDRMFLNVCTTKILELDPTNNRTAMYHGNYDHYRAEKADWFADQADAYRAQQQQKREMLAWLALKRQEAAVYPSPAKGRQIRQMERRLEREILDVAITKPKASKTIRRTGFTGAAHTGKIMIRVTEVKKSYAEQVIIENATFEIRGKTHVRLIGSNGSGKSTLLRLITGVLPPDSGTIEIGDNVRVGYFAQEQETLDLAKSVLDVFLATDSCTFTASKVRAVLGAFLFTGDTIFKKVGNLSYGERVRLQLAQLLQQENQLLILDEPTNHLDIPSREVIEQALQAYQGALLVVSHDEYFLRAIGIQETLAMKNGRVSQDRT